MSFYFFDCKASDCWAYVYSVSEIGERRRIWEIIAFTNPNISR